MIQMYHAANCISLRHEKSHKCAAENAVFESAQFAFLLRGF